MALMNCSECGHQVSERAATCPSCGNPIAMAAAVSASGEAVVVQTQGTAKRFKRDFLLGLGAAFAGFLVGVINPNAIGLSVVIFVGGVGFAVVAIGRAWWNNW